MKKIFYLILTVGLSLDAYSVESRLNSGMFDFESSDKNTSSKELPMSPYKNGKIAFYEKITEHFIQYDNDSCELTITRKKISKKNMKNLQKTLDKSNQM